MRTRVKVCCMASPAEVRAAVAAGADAIGVVGPMSSGPGPVDDETARTVIAATPPGVSPVLLTAESDFDEIMAHVRVTAASIVQIVRHIDPMTHDRIRAKAPALKIVQVIHVESQAALDLARGYTVTADALLLDSGRPDDAAVELGGTGRTHDWDVSRRIVSLVSKPVFLAGGLNEVNVGEAIRIVRPFGVDICSGVRTLGKLDVRKLSGFFAAVKLAG